MSQEEQEVLYGLTVNSTNDEIRDKVFEIAGKLKYFATATTSMDGVNPSSRCLDYNYLPDGNLYLGITEGKPVYQELMRHNCLVGNGVFITEEDHLLLAFRITASIKEATDPEMIAEYWRRNPGTKKMYGTALDIFKIFCLDKGEGEIFHVYSADRISRLRFSFGGATPRKPYYTISESCNKCNACVKACLTKVIETDCTPYRIRHNGCLECGLCYKVCPVGAIQHE